MSDLTELTNDARYNREVEGKGVPDTQELIALHERVDHANVHGTPYDMIDAQADLIDALIVALDARKGGAA